MTPYSVYSVFSVFCLFNTGRTGVYMQCTCSICAVWAACRLHWLCSAGCNYTAVNLECFCSVETWYHKRRHHSVCAVHTVACSVSEVYLQPPLQIYSMYRSVSAVCTAGTLQLDLGCYKKRPTPIDPMLIIIKHLTTYYLQALCETIMKGGGGGAWGAPSPPND